MQLIRKLTEEESRIQTALADEMFLGNKLTNKRLDGFTIMRLRFLV